MSEGQRDAVDRLCARRDELALGMDLEGSLLGSRSDLEQMVVEPEASSPLMPWQEEILRPVLADITTPLVN
jgi:hypothetical protein